jgi:hypothetical protein
MLDLRSFKYTIGASVNTQVELAAAEATRYQKKMFKDYLDALAQGRPHNLPPEVVQEWDVLLAKLKDAWARQMKLIPDKTTITPPRGQQGPKKPSPEELEKAKA